MARTPEQAARDERVEQIERASLALGLGNRWSDGPEMRSMDKGVVAPGPCGRCAHSTIWRTSDVSTADVYCGKVGRLVPPNIQWCSGEQPASAMLDLEQLEKIAVPIDVREGPPSRGTYL